jgi:hypothetical protein
VDREERLARNEDLFRDANRRVAATAVRWGLAEGELEILCECADVECSARLVVSQREYARARSDPTLFLLDPRHVRLDIEKVVTQDPRVALVQKTGEAAEVARETDEEPPPAG